MLFRVLACFLSNHATPPMMDEYVTGLTLHAVTQAIVSLQKETDDETAVAAGIRVYLEPAEFSPIRSSHTVLPRWLLDSLKTYYLEARPHFLPNESLDVVTRVFTDETRTVRTSSIPMSQSISKCANYAINSKTRYKPKLQPRNT